MHRWFLHPFIPPAMPPDIPEFVPFFCRANYESLPESFSPKSSYGVTFSTSQIFSILSADGFVPFLFQSLMVLCEIPVSSENSFWVTPFRRINSKIFSLIILYFTFSLRFCFTISQNSLSVTSSNAEKTPLPALCGFRIFFLRSNKKRNGNA